MNSSSDMKRYIENFLSERDAIELYGRLADAEKNPDLAKIYRKLIETETKHADFWRSKIKEAGGEAPVYKPGLKTKLFGWLAKGMGPSFILPAIAKIETSAASGYDGQEDAESVKMPADERSHARVFKYMTGNTSGLQGSEVARFEGRHRATGGNALRAAVLGANDGLVSVFGLVMGVAGAGVANHVILLTGFAGLLAGALSMALGEWLSVQSSRELFQHQLDIEQDELKDAPEEEVEELALIYQAKGIEAETARKMADRLITDPAAALDTLAREELGIDPEELGGSAWEAAITSFLLFSVGAIIPVLPYLFFNGWTGIVVSAAASAVGLFAVGAVITFMTGKHPLLSGLRQVLFGLAAAAVTFGIGKLIGVNLAG